MFLLITKISQAYALMGDSYFQGPLTLVGRNQCLLVDELRCVVNKNLKARSQMYTESNGYNPFKDLVLFSATLLHENQWVTNEVVQKMWNEFMSKQHNLNNALPITKTGKYRTIFRL